MKLENKFCVTDPHLHQNIGISTLYQNGWYALCDEMGLGKTLQLIYACLELVRKKQIDKIIVVCRSRHRYPWLEQFKQHAPMAPIHCVIGQPAAKRAKAWPTDALFYIVNYELLSHAATRVRASDSPSKNAVARVKLSNYRIVDLCGQDALNALTILKSYRTAIILDESQAIKNPHSKVTSAIHAFGHYAARRYICTGTPVAERPDDLWSQFYFMDRGLLLGQHYNQFIENYAVFKGGRNRKWIVGYKNLDNLRALVSPFILRRRTEECLDLPPKTMQVVPLTCSAPEQTALIRKSASELKDLLRSYGAASLSISKLYGGEYSSITEALNSLFYASSTPTVLEPDGPVGEKIEYLREFADTIRGQQIIVWGFHKKVVEEAAKQCGRLGIGSATYVHGSITGSERDKRVSEFIGSKCRVMCATVGVLSEAYTFTNCKYAYYLERSWSLTQWKQSQARIHRIGTMGTVVICSPILGPLDTYIREHIAQKESNATQAVDRSTADISKERLLYHLQSWIESASMRK